MKKSYFTKKVNINQWIDDNNGDIERFEIQIVSTTTPTIYVAPSDLQLFVSKKYFESNDQDISPHFSIFRRARKS